MRAAPAALAACALAAMGLVAWADDAGDDADAESIAAFDTVYRVLTSPRCRNCHPSGDRPLQKDAGVPHAQNVSRRSTDNGLRCATCHRERNGRAEHSPPGAPHWGLPPASAPMPFQDRTAHQLCEQLKDPAQTNGRDLAALVEHVSHDPLVAWGWAPGPGRTTPPVDFDDFVAAFRRWVDQGAACPP